MKPLMIGINEALQELKVGLDLVDAQAVPSSSKDFVAMSARNSYYNFRSLGVYLDRLDTPFELVATTPQFSYPNKQDPLGFDSYIETYKPEEWNAFKKQYNFILTDMNEKIKPFKHAAGEVRGHWWSNKDKIYERRMKIRSYAENALLPLKQKAEDLCQLITQKVEVGDSAILEISAAAGDSYVASPNSWYMDTNYVPDISMYWELRSRLSVSMPSKVKKTHPLVVGVSNNLASIELSMPVNDPSIVVNIETDKKKDPIYQFELKDRGVEKETLKNMMNLLLI